MRALDLFCGAGGATRGLQLAGFHVTGVDRAHQPRYVGETLCHADVLGLSPSVLRQFDFIWASPPCQAFTAAQRIMRRSHPDLIGAVRAMLNRAGAPYCIENVPGAPLCAPIELCGQAFGLGTYRHRIFECSFPIAQPWHAPHTARQTKMGRPVKDGEFIQVVGNFSGVQRAREAMGIDWMARDELSEAIPPAFAEYIGKAALAFIRQIEAA